MQYGGTVYILKNVHHEVLYIGVTSDLFTRIPEHITKVYPNSFTAKYNCNKLVYYDMSQNRGCNCKRKTTDKMEIDHGRINGFRISIPGGKVFGPLKIT